MGSGAFIAGKVDRQSWSNSIGCYCSEIPGSDQTSHKVITMKPEAERTANWQQMGKGTLLFRETLQ